MSSKLPLLSVLPPNTKQALSIITHELPFRGDSIGSIGLHVFSVTENFSHYAKSSTPFCPPNTYTHESYMQNVPEKKALLCSIGGFSMNLRYLLKKRERHEKLLLLSLPPSKNIPRLLGRCTKHEKNKNGLGGTVSSIKIHLLLKKSNFITSYVPHLGQYACNIEGVSW